MDNVNAEFKIELENELWAVTLFPGGCKISGFQSFEAVSRWIRDFIIDMTKAAQVSKGDATIVDILKNMQGNKA